MQGFCPAPPLPQYPPASEARPPTAAESQKELFLFFGGRRRIPEEILAKPNHGHKKEPVMGVLINKKAAVDDIVSDCRTTLTAAEARGGTTQTLAQQYLKGPLGVSSIWSSSACAVPRRCWRRCSRSWMSRTMTPTGCSGESPMTSGTTSGVPRTTRRFRCCFPTGLAFIPMVPMMSSR
jgi:hypothetical protein